MYTVADPPPSMSNPNQDDMDEDEEEDEEDDEVESGSEDETDQGHNQHATSITEVAEPSELMQIEMPDDIRIGSPNDGSNNLDSDFHLLAVSNQGNLSKQVDSYKTERWGPIEEHADDSLQVQLSSSGKPAIINKKLLL